MPALWRVARPAIEAAAAARGVPLALHDYAELGLDTLSVAEARRRDPYSRPEGFAAEFARLEAGGWLARTGGASGAEDARYADLQRLFHAALPRDAALFNEYHALIVRHATARCRKRAPLCESCPLSDACRYAANAGE